MNTQHSNAIRILLADDDEEDRYFVSRALTTISAETDVRTVRNGEELLAFLRGPNATPTATLNPWPNLILLDLNMPCMDGREALHALKCDEQLCAIPVIVLTTSNNERDIDCCYRLGASSYLVKPKAYDEILDVMQRLVDYWADLVALPCHVSDGRQR